MYLGRVVIIVFSIIVLSGCSLSIEEASEKTLNAVEQSLSEENNEANEKSGQISYYLPPQYTVDSESNNNIVLTYKDQTFILFVNPYEQKDSEVLYQSTVESYDSPEVTESFSNEGEFGYVIIDEIDNNEDELYEITVGVGGVKMTTVTNTNNMEESANVMMDVVSSVIVEELGN
ncbi:hypothetical protein [Sutcliffiella halmapala]|uniref:hypothetical protein n=1 Tax=Sutcliffiella halmapala TaxID=79882 RepID=UPI0009952B2D|nr:hypothetical protein [Sutcliffiella halmapala]